MDGAKVDGAAVLHLLIGYHRRLADLLVCDADMHGFHAAAAAYLEQVSASQHELSVVSRRETIARMEVESIRAENAALLAALSRAGIKGSP